MSRQNLKTFARRLAGDRRGNVAMMVALSIAPLTLASMGAVDMTRGVAAKVALQDALDAAALAVGHSSSTDSATLQALGERILTQNLAGAQDFKVTSSSFKLDANNAVVASAQGQYQPSMAGLFGAGPATFSASAEVTRANAMLEIAMVLDNTGSMNETLNSSQSKIEALRTAAGNFLDTMSKASPQNSSTALIKVALVPFANMVRLDPNWATADWIDTNQQSPLNDEIFTTAQGKTQSKVDRMGLFKALGTNWAGCVETRKSPYDVEEAVPTNKDYATFFTPFFAPDESDYEPPTISRKGVVTIKANTNGNNYVADPFPIWDSKGAVVGDWWKAQGDTAKYKGTHKSFAGNALGPNRGCSMQTVHRLTTDFAGLKTSISSMTAGGETNIPNGLFWGWMTLSPNLPLEDGAAYGGAKHKKIVVLMTDGENTMSTDSGNLNNSTYSAAGYVWQGRFRDKDGNPVVDIASSSDTRTAAMNVSTEKICANMKAADVNIEIYTIGVGVTDAAAKKVLQDCASGTDHYFDVSSSSAINTAFQSVANQIAQLHLSK